MFIITYSEQFEGMEIVCATQTEDKAKQLCLVLKELALYNRKYLKKYNSFIFTWDWNNPSTIHSNVEYFNKRDLAEKFFFEENYHPDPSLKEAQDLIGHHLTTKDFDYTEVIVK